jgi:hypothetical protein
MSVEIWSEPSGVPPQLALTRPSQVVPAPGAAIDHNSINVLRGVKWGRVQVRRIG